MHQNKSYHPCKKRRLFGSLLITSGLFKISVSIKIILADRSSLVIVFEYQYHGSVQVVSMEIWLHTKIQLYLFCDFKYWLLIINQL